MEANSVIQEPQKKQEELNEENSKSLGNLPEDVLLDILSLLPTKEAVRTSLLSKRWEYLWASMSNLVFDGSLPAKRTICFPNLKILTMEGVTFSDDYLIQQLLSAPPLLEKLELHNCSWGDRKVLTISTPKLQYLSIREYERRRSSNGDVCQVMIFGESLKEFYYMCFFRGDYCLYDSASLKKAGSFKVDIYKIDIYHGSFKEFFTIWILLNNAIVLEEIVITCSEYFANDLVLQEIYYKQLRELPRRSHNCKMVLKTRPSSRKRPLVLVY